jgi:hypothetical protein
MKSIRVLVLGLLLSGYIAEPPGHEGGGGGNDGRESSQELWRRPSRNNATTKLFRLMGKNTIWTRVATGAGETCRTVCPCPRIPTTATRW